MRSPSDVCNSSAFTILASTRLQLLYEVSARLDTTMALRGHVKKVVPDLVSYFSLWGSNENRKHYVDAFAPLEVALDGKNKVPFF